MKKIGLISDPHATLAPLAEALALFRQKNVDMIWCTGDVVGYGEALDDSVSLLQEYGCRTICGNHEQWYLDKVTENANLNTVQYIKSLPQVIEENVAGKQLYMVHASPPLSTTNGIRLLDLQGSIIAGEQQRWMELLSGFEADVLIVGHTHQVFAEQLGQTLVINPGSCRFNHSCAILVLPELDVEWFSLSGEDIRPAWNWGSEML